MSHKDTENLNRPITKTETLSVIKILLIKKSPGLDGFTREFYQIFKELIPILVKLIKVTERKGCGKRNKPQIDKIKIYPLSLNPNSVSHTIILHLTPLHSSTGLVAWEAN